VEWANATIWISDRRFLENAAQQEKYMEKTELEQKLVNKRTIAARYGVSERTIQDWMVMEMIPYFKLGYVVRFDPESCDQAIARFRVGSDALDP
jgi:hypothetical protein